MNSVVKQRYDIVKKELDRLYPKTPDTPLVYSKDWQFIIAVILSAQCTDGMVNKVTSELFEQYPTLQAVAEADIHELEEAVYSTGFYKNKAKNIKTMAAHLITEFDGKVPDAMDQLLSLSGVGRKTANVVMGELFGKAEGIVVDTHIKRLSRKFGLTNAKSADAIEKDLIGLICKDDWWSIPAKMKRYGQEYSPAKIKDYSDPIGKELIKMDVLSMKALS